MHPARPTLTVVATIAIASLVAACASDGDGTATLDAIETAEEIVDVTDSGVGVLATGCGTTTSAGSGVAVDTELVATVAHTVAGADEVTVVDAAGRRRPATVVAFDVRADLAMLAVAGLESPPLAIADAEIGAAATMRWTDDAGVEQRPARITTRLAITIDDIYGRDTVERSGLEIAAAIDVGDSGGAVTSPTGDVVGIVYARSQSRGSTAFATDAAELRTVLAAVDDAGVDTGDCI